MKLSLLHQPAASASASPYRLVDQGQQEVAWANAFLDAQRIRQLSLGHLQPERRVLAPLQANGVSIYGLSRAKCGRHRRSEVELAKSLRRRGQSARPPSISPLVYIESTCPTAAGD
jgi:hypothetical protein